MAWLVFAWARPAFPADVLAPGDPPATTAQIGDDASADSPPADAVTFLNTSPATPANKPSSSLRLAPIATRAEGNVGYSIEQRTSSGANARLHQKLLLNLKGRASSYIWQPWMAKVRGDLSLAASKSKTDDSSSSGNTIWGTAGLYLVPYSRYPFEASISRNQNYSGPGIGSFTTQTTRLDLNQRYTPRHKKENYRVGYNLSQTDSVGSDSDRQTGLSFSVMSNRFKYQTIEASANRDRDMRLKDGSSTLSNQARVHHTYRPNAALSLGNNAILQSSSDQAALAPSSSTNREFNSTLSLQPSQTHFSVIGSARVNVNDQSRQMASSQTRVANASLGANYRPSQYLHMSASGNVNVTETNSVRTRRVTTSQSVNANHPLAMSDLGAYRYTSQISGSITNRTDLTGSVQSISIGPGHSLNRAMGLNGGNLSLGLNQGVSVSESTRSQASSALSHSGSANWRRVQGKSDTALKLSGRDSRSLSNTQNSSQSIAMGATISEEFSRNSNLSGSLAVQAMRQVSNATPSPSIFTSSSATLRYNHNRAFDTPRLIFVSDVQVYSRAPIPVLVAPSQDQGPIIWNNTLSYTVGRLFAEFTVSMSKEGDGGSQSLIALSLRRYF